MDGSQQKYSLHQELSAAKDACQMSSILEDFYLHLMEDLEPIIHWVILYCSMPKQCLFLGPFELDKPWRHHNVLWHIFGSGQDVFLCVAFLLLWVWKITQDCNISPTWKPKGKVQPKVNILSPTHMSPATFFLPCNITFEYRGCSFPYKEKNDSFVELQCKNLMGCFQSPLIPYNGFVYGKD